MKAKHVIHCLGIFLAFTSCQAVFAQSANPSWLEKEKSVRAAIDEDRVKEASRQAIVILQEFEKNKVAETDPNLKIFFLQDLADICTDLTDADDKLNFGKWEYSIASNVWGTHSVPYLFSLRRMFICDAYKRHDYDQSKNKYCQEFSKLYTELLAGPQRKLVLEWLKMESENNVLSLKRSNEKMKRIFQRSNQSGLDSKSGATDPRVQAVNDELRKAKEMLKF